MISTCRSRTRIEFFATADRYFRGIAFALAVLCAASALPAAPAISGASILERVKVLASDEFEGRAPGTAGETKTIEYLVSEFKKLGLEPGNPDGTFVQAVPLLGLVSTPVTTFAVGDRTIAPELVNDYTVASRRVAPQVEVADSDIVFVGYGVVAPEYDWDDFKDVDVRGKTLLMLINDPPVPDPQDPRRLDESVFKGRAMTYYGRWTYKYEIASEKGAAACLIIHETGPAGYPFAVVGGGIGRENFDLRTPDGNASRIAAEGWLTLDLAKRLLSAAGHNFDVLKSAAAQRDFRPVALDAKANIRIANTTRDLASQNVIARLPGRDPQHAHEHLVYTAHWDHLGRDPRLSGDQIFNGATDNASGTAMLLELAQAFAALPPSERPMRSLLFLAVTAEERGLLGSRYYAENPLHPLTQTLANINIDGANPHGRTFDIEIVGSGASTLDDVATAVATAQGRETRPDSNPEKGYYYRSDHFEFAKVGVPAFYPKAGLRYIGESPEYGRKLHEDYTNNDYHKVTDEVKPGWTFDGAAQDTEFLFEMGRRIADADTWPEWKPGNEFKARRDAMLSR